MFMHGKNNIQSLLLHKCNDIFPLKFIYTGLGFADNQKYPVGSVPYKRTVLEVVT